MPTRASEDTDQGHAPSAPELREAEVQQVEERAAPRAAVVYEAIRLEGEDELQRPVAALAWSGIAAGLSMGFSMVAMGLIRGHLPDAPWRPLVASLGYSVGFLWSYAVNRRWTFQHRGPVPQSFTRFALVCGFAYAVNLAVLALARAALGADTFWPHVLGMAAYTTVGFLGSQFYAFHVQRSLRSQP